MHVHRLGNAQPIRVGLPHRWGWTDWERSPGYAERCDSQSVAQIFSRARVCVDFAVYRTPDFRQVRMMKRLAVMVLLTLLVPQLASAKRIAPAKVDPVSYEGIRYVAPNDEGRRAYIEEWNVMTNKKQWELTIFTNRIDPNLEEDVQWVFIKALNIQDGRLFITAENGKSYQVDPKTKEIAQSDSRPSVSPGTNRDVPEAVQKALTNGRKYDLSFRMNPSYLEGDFNADGKMDTAVLVNERSTGKIGIAIVHAATGKVTILGAGIAIGNGGDDFDWLDSWQVYSKTRAAHAAGETSVAHLRRCPSG
jgi:hypothetical protein